MSLLDKSSLIVTPNAYKASKLYSVIPTSGAGDMTVVRATTATRKNSAGFIESVAVSVPRIDYTNGSCPSLLVEPQRTNIQLNSEDFSQSSWTKTLSAVVANQINSPSGILTADKLNETATTGNHQLESSRNVTAGAYSMSVFAKKAEREWLYLFEDTTGKGAYFNLNNGTIGTIAAGATAKIENFGNGWYRCSVTYSEIAVFGRYRIAVTTGNGVTSYTGVANNGIYIWGAQYELGAYSTSYIPTVASSVSRNAEVISKTGISSLIGQTEGTLFLDFYFKTPQSNVGGQIALKDNTGNNRVIIWNNFSLNTLGVQLKANASNIINNTSLGTFVNNQRYKIAIAYKSGDCAVYLNGSLAFQNTTSFTFSSPMTDLVIGAYELSFLQEGHQLNNSTQLYKTRLTNTELAQLTTL